MAVSIYLATWSILNRRSDGEALKSVKDQKKKKKKTRKKAIRTIACKNKFAHCARRRKSIANEQARFSVTFFCLLQYFPVCNLLCSKHGGSSTHTN